MLNLPSFKVAQVIKIEGNKPVTNWREYLSRSKEEFEQKYKRKSVQCCSKLGDFELIRTVGTGWFGRVILVKDRVRNSYHALKVFKKESIIQLDQVRHVYNEKKIFEACDFPFITPLQRYFTDNSNIYFVMPFIVGGELFSLLRRFGNFSESTAKFYSAQIILVLEYLHNIGVVYRDIKPENILIDKDGYIKVTDFGFAKLLTGRTYTMCGTPEYFAPEMITNAGYTASVDWWSLGILIYEMCCGHSPFAQMGRTRANSVLGDIVRGLYILPSFFSDDLKDVILGLLQIEVWKRICGARLRQQPWYKKVNWLDVINKKIPPPYLPNYSGDADTSNYDFFDETPLITSSDDDFNKVFADF